MPLVFKRLTKRKVMYLAGSVVIIPILIVVAVFSLVRMELIDDLPSKRQLKHVQSPEASELYSSDGRLLGRYYSENRTNVSIDDINDDLRNALIATEDRRFLKHNGVDVKGLSRVFFKTLLLQKNSGGGSTLSQQLVKHLYPRKDYPVFSTLINKSREMIIAQRLERLHSKDEILLMYCNTVPFGERAFGIHSASKRFFNKHPKDLKLEEAATLVGMLKATTYYSPRRNPERSLARRNVVLGQMSKYGYLDEQVAESTKALALTLDYNAYNSNTEIARYFKSHVKKELLDWASKRRKNDGSRYDINKDGLKIYTTLDYDMQVAAERNMKRHMADLQRLFESSWGKNGMFQGSTRLIDEGIVSNHKYQSILASTKDKKQALQQFNSEDHRRLWTWQGYQKQSSTRIDSIKHYLKLLHAGVFAVNPKNGEIKVWIGGNNYSHFPYDNIKNPRQVGSTFKPIVYLAALEQGLQPCDYYPNELRQYNDYQNWKPRNASNKYGGYIPAKEGLAQSINTVSVQVLFETGVPNVVRTAKSMGITSDLSEVPSIVLGTSDISLYEMVKAYSVLASGGKKRDLESLLRIEDKDGNIIYDAVESRRKVRTSAISKQSIDRLNAMLYNATVNGTGRSLYSKYNIPFQVMGKTGTTQNQSDGWFIGYTEDLVVGSWVGAQDRRIHFKNLSTGSGGRTALPLVAGVFQHAAKKGLRSPDLSIDSELYDCYDFLTEDEYQYLQDIENGSFFQKLFARDVKEVTERNNKKNNRKKKKNKKPKKNDNLVAIQVAEDLLELLSEENKAKYGDEIRQLEGLLSEIEQQR